MRLLDVNVWLAAAWARHSAHELVKGWFDDQEDDLAFCRITEMSLLRLMSKRADRSHLLWTDDYLAAFAQVAGATLVSLDRKLITRYPSVTVEVLR